MEDRSVKLIAVISSALEADEYEMAELTQQLRQELLNADVSNVEYIEKGSVPEHAKAVDVPVTWGTLLITMMASGGILTTFIHAIQDWLIQRKHEVRSVKLTLGENSLEIDGGSPADQQRLIDQLFEYITKTKAADPD